MLEAGDMDERFLQQLVADYLEKSSLLKTLESFYQESAVAETRPPPVHIEEIAAKLQLPVDGNESKSVLGYLIDNYLRDCALRMRESPNNMMEKLLARPKPSRPFNSRKSSHTNTSTSESTPSRPRPASVSSTPDANSTPYSLKQSDDLPSLKGSNKSPHSMRSRKVDKRYVRNNAALNISSENWLPMTMRMNSVGRSVMVAHENLKTAVRHAQPKGQESHLRDYEAFIKAEALGMMKREACGCCGYSKFPSISLVTTVSLKAVIDIRKRWESSAVGLFDSDTRLVVPRCYDEVRICRFCSQFFHDQEEYRPSFDSIRQSERRKLILARQSSRDSLDPLKLCEDDRLREEEEDSVVATGNFMSQSSQPSLTDSYD